VTCLPGATCAAFPDLGLRVCVSLPGCNLTPLSGPPSPARSCLHCHILPSLCVLAQAAPRPHPHHVRAPPAHCGGRGSGGGHQLREGPRGVPGQGTGQLNLPWPLPCPALERAQAQRPPASSTDTQEYSATTVGCLANPQWWISALGRPWRSPWTGFMSAEPTLTPLLLLRGYSDTA